MASLKTPLSARGALFAILGCCALFGLPGCDNSFTPKQSYKERLVVYCVLDPSQPCQMVRIESTYDAAGTNPNEPLGKREITTAVVRVSTLKKSFLFTDTLVDNGSGGLKKVWISRDLVPTEGSIYTLTADVPGNDRVTATVQVPSKPYLDIVPPQLSVGKTSVELRASAISTVAPPKGFYFRLILIGQLYVNGRWVDIQREVPQYIDAATGDSVRTKPGRESSVSFSFDIINGMKARMQDLEGADNIQILGLGYSLDNFLYSYFQTVRGFDDPVSVRQDRPDVTNVVGGVGIFGAIVPDSLRRPYLSLITGR